MVMTPQEARDLFPILQERAYLFSGGIAPATRRTLESIRKHLDDLTYDPDDLFFRTHEDFQQVRRLFAELMGADEKEIVINDSTSAGSNLAAELIEPRPGGNVVFDEFAYPSSVFPWLLPPRDQVECRFVKPRDGLIHLQDMEHAVDDNTLAVSVAHITPMEGFRHDVTALARLAHRHGALMLVDGAQSAGALDINLHETDVDFFSTTAMKWLLGPAGVGFFYVAQRHLNRVPPQAGYAGGGFDIHHFAPPPTADRFQLGMPNLIGMGATRPGLEILLEIGMENVEAHVLELSGQCISGLLKRGLKVLTPAQAQHRGGVIAVEMDDSRELWHFLYQRGVDTFYDGNLFRVDPHIFNNQDDINRFLEGVDDYLSGDPESLQTSS